jgi:GT2 family glycosyltransferase
MDTMAFAIINHNTRDHLRACLQSINPYCQEEVLVVDNASTDGSQDMVKQKFPQVRLLVNQHNPGYGTAANQAVQACHTPLVLLLNSDTRLQSEAGNKLANYMQENPQAGIVGPRLLNADGSLQMSCFPFPSPLNTLVRETLWGRLLERIPWLKHRHLLGWSHDRSRRVPWVLGAAMALRKSAFEALGGFDENFFLYYEEIDLCYRIIQAGWEVHFAPVTEVIHIREASTSQQRHRMIYELYVSMHKFYLRHYSPWTVNRLKGVIGYVMLRNTLRDRLRLAQERDLEKRRQLEEDLAAWRSVFSGVVTS